MEDANGSRASTSTMMTTIEPAVEAAKRRGGGGGGERRARGARDRALRTTLGGDARDEGAEEGEKKVEMFAYGTYGDYVRGLREGKMKELTTGEALVRRLHGRADWKRWARRRRFRTRG